MIFLKLKTWYEKYGGKLAVALTAIALILPSLIAGWSVRQVRQYTDRVDAQEQIISSILKGELPIARVCEEQDAKCFVPVSAYLANRIGTIEQRLNPNSSISSSFSLDPIVQ